MYSKTTPKARKQYYCELCARPIEIGEQHDKVAGVVDGDFWSLRMHTKCSAAAAGWDQEDWECTEPEIFRREYLGEVE